MAQISLDLKRGGPTLRREDKEDLETMKKRRRQSRVLPTKAETGQNCSQCLLNYHYARTGRREGLSRNEVLDLGGQDCGGTSFGEYHLGDVAGAMGGAGSDRKTDQSASVTRVVGLRARGCTDMAKSHAAVKKLADAPKWWSRQFFFLSQSPIGGGAPIWWSHSDVLGSIILGGMLHDKRRGPI